MTSTNETALPVRSADAAGADPPKEEKKAIFDPKRDVPPHILAQLDPQWVAIFTERINANPPPPRDLYMGPNGIDYVRAHPEKFAPPSSLDTKGYPRTAENEVVSEDGAKVPVRVYYPDEKIWGPGPYPVHLNFHGGGFVFGGLDYESRLCMSMCDGAGVAVVDVNYRHCPENIWGKCFQDAFAALKWARDDASSLNFDASSVSFGGCSAGAAISSILHHLARDEGIPIKLVMLTVPGNDRVLSYKFYTDSTRRSFLEFNSGPDLSWTFMKWLGSYAMPPDKMAELEALWPDWWFSPFTAPNFEGLCPVFVRTAGCDPLRDEGEAYAQKLVEEGVRVTMKRYRGAVHSFFQTMGLRAKEEYDADSIWALKDAHGTGKK